AAVRRRGRSRARSRAGVSGLAQTRGMRILLTGFEPFAGRGINPSWEAARQLEGSTAGPARIDVLRVPVVWRESVATIVRELEREPAAGLIIGGLSFGRAAISVEAI